MYCLVCLGWQRGVGPMGSTPFVLPLHSSLTKEIRMTVSLADAIAALERHVGFRRGRLVSVSQRLQNAGVIPTGAPRTAPQLSLDDVLRIVVAYAADAPLHRSAASVATYSALTPGGADTSGAPAHIRATAGQELRAIAELAAAGDVDMRRLRIEVVSTWPEVAVYFADGEVHRFQPLGTIPNHWQATGHRKAITINGAAFCDVFDSLFGANNGANK